MSFWTAIVSVSCFLMLEYSLRTCCSFEPSNSPSCICHDGGSRRAIVFWCRVFILDWKNCQWIGGTKNLKYSEVQKVATICKVNSGNWSMVSYFLSFDVWIHLTKTTLMWMFVIVVIEFPCFVGGLFMWPMLVRNFGACCKCHKVRKSVPSFLSTFLLMRFESGSR